MVSKRRHLRRRFVHRKIQVRLRIYAVILFALLALIAYDVLAGVIGLALAAVGIALGVVVGLFVWRMFNIRWHEESGKIIAEMDLIGVVVLVAYLIFAILRNWLFSVWIAGPMLGTFGFCVIAGTFVGRIWGTDRTIARILHSRGLLKRR